MNDRKEFFESYADEWDKNFTAEDMELISYLVKTLGIKPNDKIADLGCGTGVLFDTLRRNVGPGGLVVGVDFSHGMTHKAHKNFPFDNCLAVNADVLNLPLKSESFDMAVSLAAFPHFPDPDKVMSEAARILKRGAAFHIIHLLSSQELCRHHHHAGGPVAMDHLPPQEKMMLFFEQGHFLNVSITDQPGLYHARGVKG
jgi:ubiquinone/menaquinone biosynthesis C-methylase UbiE